MLKKTKKGYYVLEKFAHQKGIVHAFSSRKFGNLRARKSLTENQNLDKFLKIFGLKKQDLILMGQVHSDNIKVVANKEKGKILPATDGMLCFQKEIVLGVKMADCLPIVFYDPGKKIIGIAHGGWQGVFKRISQKIVKKMARLGSRPEDILVGIGPHIGSCCYSVPPKRSQSFKKEFGNLKGMITNNNKNPHLDLLAPTIFQLVQAGIKKQNIDFGPNCTFCQKEEFFSFRREKGKNSSLLGIICLV